MTQQQIIQEFRRYPKATKSVVIRKLLEIFEEDLEDSPNEKKELSIEERLEIAKSLGGSLKITNPPMTKQEDREMYYSHLAEKHK